jgi:hypothetical protein
MFFVLLSCDNSHLVKEYYDNGSLRKECEIFPEKDSMYCVEFTEDSFKIKTGYKKNKISGIQEFYYFNGKRKAFGNFVNGMRNGYYATYYENGILNQIGFLYNDTLIGEVKLYDDKGRLTERQFYANFYNTENNRCWVEYDSIGRVIYETRRVEILPIGDTINNNIEIGLELRQPKFDSTWFIVGDFDHRFNLKDSTSLDTIFAMNHKAVMPKSFHEPGIHFIRGFAVNFRNLEENKDDSTYKIERIPYVYFEKLFYVIPK